MPADDDAADAELATVGAAVALLLCTMKRPHVVQLGLERGYISPDAEFGGITLTHIAGEDVELLRCLVDKGANVKRDNGKGGTPLHAKIKNKFEAASLFLINDAPNCNVDTADDRGRTPFVARGGGPGDAEGGAGVDPQGGRRTRWTSRAAVPST